MKPISKSSIALKFLRFFVAFFLFMFVCVTLSPYLAKWRDASQYRFFDAKVSSNGQVTYLVSIYSEGRTGFWEFDEKLLHPLGKQYLGSRIESNSQSIVITPVTVKNIERNSYKVEFITGPDDGGPIIWWNGPAGQVDLYDRITHMREASLGPSGHSVMAPDRPEDRFDVLHKESRAEYIVTPEGIYNLWERLPDIRIKLVYRGSCEGFAQGYLRHWKNRVLLIVNENTISVRDTAGGLLRNFKLPEIVSALLNGGNVTFTLFDNGMMAIRGRNNSWNKKTILILDEDGALERQVDYDIDKINKTLNRGGAGRTRVLFPTLMPPIPVPGFMEKLALVQSIALSLVLAAVVLWRQTRREGRGKLRVAWAVFTLVFGLLGFVTYLVACRDRRFEPCPDCRRLRPIAEEICPHCSSSWPAPKPLGIEIIDTTYIPDFG